MSNSSSSETSKTDWVRVRSMSDDDIDLTDIPEVPEAQMARAVLRVGGVTVERGQQQVSLPLDTVVLAYFKAKAGEAGYQSLINTVLATYVLTNADRDYSNSPQS